MKKILLLFIASILCLPSLNAQSGGPDAYGYTWTSSGAGGVTYNWVDITGLPGVQTVSGLADDNSAPSMINIGFPFQFYWSQYSQLKVGSNGWLSFNNVGNIASCFPNIPTAGGAGDNYLAPLMSDLLFSATSPGTVQYWTNNTDQFIISYLNVPFWSVNAPGYTGTNSFQVILSAADSSITYQYQTLSGYVNGSCAADMVVGIENSTGNIGLQCYADVSPPSTFAIKFDPPNVPLISVPDAKASWNQNVDNKAEIVVVGSATPITVAVRNAGNVDLTTTTSASLSIATVPGASVVYTDAISIPSLTQGTENQYSATSFNPATAGDYAFTLSTSNSADINPSNNSIVTELLAIDVCQANTTLDYLGGATPNMATINWNGGANDDGVGVYYEPPMAPYDINSLQFYIANNTSDGFIATVYDDDGANGAPGTVLYTTTVASGSVLNANWNTVTLPSPITLTSGGFYVAWFQGGTTINLGLSTTAPFSNQNYEILDNGWGVFRYNTTQDAGIRSNISISNPLTVDFTNTPQAGTTVQFNDISVGNLASWLWDFGDGNTSTQQNPTHTYSTPGNYLVCLTVFDLCGNSDMLCTTVSACPDITPSQEPLDDLGCVGLGAQFSVTAEADGYQWQEDQGSGFNDLTDGGVYSGSLTSTLNLSGLTLSMNTYNYRCVLTNNCGDSYTTVSAELTVDPCLGLAENTQVLMEVFPNPNKGNFTVKTTTVGGLIVSNSVGAQVHEQTLQNGENLIDAQHLAPGVYYLTFTSEGARNVTRIVIQ
jgi:hypothetical protein